MTAAHDTLPPIVSAPAPQVSGKTLLAGIALSSFSALLLELSLTRLFSVVLFYHFAFLAISIALLGLGAGGVYAHLRQDVLKSRPLRNMAVVCAALTAIAIPIALEIILHVPVSLDLTGENFLRLTAIYICSAVPFFLTGVQFSAIFARESSHIPRLYGADLLGGALACLTVIPLLNWIGGPNAILFSALVAAIAAVVWSPRTKIRKLTLALSVAIATLIALNHSGRLMDVVWAKGIRQQKVEFSRWNAISRVEVDGTPDGGKVIIIDADANTFIMNADPQHWEGSDWQAHLMSSSAAVVNALRPHGSYAIIGPGGGVDVLRAVANGSPSVTGIEINPVIANTIMRGRYADFAYHLYQRPEVHIHVTDGRSYLRSTPQSFDVVQMTLVDTWASTAAGAFALSENNLYTVEAFREYFEHLKPDGMIAITRWEFRQPREALRVVSVAMQALHRLGVANPAHNFIVASQGSLDEDGIPVVVLAKKTPFTIPEESAVTAHFDRYSELDPLYLPSEPGHNPFSDLIASNDPYGFARGYAYNVAPVNDNAPFFFFTLKARQILGEKGLREGIDWKVNLGVLVLLLVLVISFCAVLVFLVLPLALKGGKTRQSPLPLLYFVAVGLGYILVEIAFIQRFVLFLGHPTYALTVVIFLLMLSSGAGSLFSRRWLPRAEMGWIPIVLVIVTLLANLFL